MSTPLQATTASTTTTTATTATTTTPSTVPPNQPTGRPYRDAFTYKTFVGSHWSPGSGMTPIQPPNANVKVSQIQFQTLKSDEIELHSVVEVAQRQYYSPGTQQASYFGPLDPRLGTSAKDGKCTTCQKSLVDCVGHFGHVKLELPVFHIGFIREIGRILQAICKRCSRVLLPSEQHYEFYLDVAKRNVHDRRKSIKINDDVLDLAKRVKICPHCDSRQGQVKKMTGLLKFVHDLRVKETKKDREKKLDVEQIRKRNVRERFLLQQRERDQLIQMGLDPNDPNNLSSSFLQPSFPLNSTSTQTTNIISSSWTDELKKSVASAERYNSEISQHLDKVIIELSPLLVLRLFSAIPNDDCYLLNLDPNMNRPESLIMTKLPVPPVCIRPSVSMGASGTNEDDLTIKIGEIVQTNIAIQQGFSRGLPTSNIVQHWDFLQQLVAQYINSDLPGVSKNLHPTKPIRALVQRLKGKQGRFRGNLSGKRVDFSGRTVISPDPNLAIDQVGVPARMAKILTFPEKVTRFNIHRLRRCVLNGPDTHPGANTIEWALSGRKVNLRYAKRAHCAGQLAIGDIVERHLDNDDTVLFNRQPSLHRMSIMAHRVKVHEWRTLRFNECACIAEGTLVDLSDGSRVPIEMVQSGQKVVSYGERQKIENLVLDENNNVINNINNNDDDNNDNTNNIKYPTYDVGAEQTVLNVFDNGFRKCYKITLIDGTELVATPDHKILVAKPGQYTKDEVLDGEIEPGTWVTVDELKSSIDKYNTIPHQDQSLITEVPFNVVRNALTSGPKRYFDVQNDAQTYSHFNLAGISYQNHPTKVLSLARLIGHVSNNGHIQYDQDSNQYQACHFVASTNDANRIISDAKMIHPDVTVSCIFHQNEPTYGSIYRVVLGSQIADLYRQTGISGDHNSIFSTQIPHFISNQSTPIEVIRQFLGGFCGGNGGLCPVYNNNNDDSCTNDTNVSINHKGLITQLIKPIDDSQDALENAMKHNLQLIGKIDGVFETIIDAFLRIGVILTTTSSITTSTNTTIISNIDENDNFDKIKKIIEENHNNVENFQYLKAFSLCVSQQENYFNQIPIHYCEEKVTKWSIFMTYSKYKLRFIENNLQVDVPDTKRRHIIDKTTNIINFDKFLTLCNFSWSQSPSLTKSNPSYSLQIEKIEPIDGDIHVYDLQIEKNHNFSAAGIIVHNCTPYNADFDGDEMNIHLPQTYEAKAEASELMSVLKNLVTPRHGEPLVCATQDFITGSFLITSKNRFITRAQFHQYTSFMDDGGDMSNERLAVPPPAILKPMQMWTGKQVFSYILSPRHAISGLNYIPYSPNGINSVSGGSLTRRYGIVNVDKLNQPGITSDKHHNNDTKIDKSDPFYAPTLLYTPNYTVYSDVSFPSITVELRASNCKKEHCMDPNDGYIVIRNSEVMCGNITKDALGGSKKGMYYQIIRAGSDGVLSAARFLSRTAKFASRFVQSQGFSIGIDDVTPSIELIQSKQRLVDAGYKKSLEFIEQYKRGELQLRPGCNELETLEASLLGELSAIRSDAGQQCFDQLNILYNSPLIMAVSGSKGSKINISQMTACVGQQAISGSRIPEGFHLRTLPHFPKHSRDPDAKGFVQNSFYTGLTASEFFFHTCLGQDHQILTNLGYLFGDQIQTILSNQKNQNCENNNDNTNNDELLFAQYCDETKTISYTKPLNWIYRQLSPNEQMYKITSKIESDRWITPQSTTPTDELKTNIYGHYTTQNNTNINNTDSNDDDDDRVSLFVTGNHDMWVQSCDEVGNELSNFTKIRAENLLTQPSSQFKFTGIVPSGLDINIKTPVLRGNIDLVYQRFGIENNVIKQNAFLSLLGHYINNNGSISRQNTSLLTTFGLINTIDYDLDTENDTIVIKNNNFNQFLSQNTTQTLPSWYNSLSKDESRSLMSGLQSTSHNDGIIMTKSIQLRDQIMILSLHAGYTSYFTLSSTDNTTWNIIYTDDINNKAVAPIITKNDISKVIDYNDVVYCVTVPTGLIITRRARRYNDDVVYASRPIIIGNCGGREGLVDTAVKTAETGYMQRRLLKALEDLCVHYDRSVRTSEGNVIQFVYGDDGLDPLFMADAPLPVNFGLFWEQIRAIVQSWAKPYQGKNYRTQPLILEYFNGDNEGSNSNNDGNDNNNNKKVTKNKNDKNNKNNGKNNNNNNNSSNLYKNPLDMPKSDIVYCFSTAPLNVASVLPKSALSQFTSMHNYRFNDTRQFVDWVSIVLKDPSKFTLSENLLKQDPSFVEIQHIIHKYIPQSNYIVPNTTNDNDTSMSDDDDKIDNVTTTTTTTTTNNNNTTVNNDTTYIITPERLEQLLHPHTYMLPIEMMIVVCGFALHPATISLCSTRFIKSMLKFAENEYNIMNTILFNSTDSDYTHQQSIRQSPQLPPNSIYLLLQAKPITTIQVNLWLNGSKSKYTSAVIESGTAVGAIAGQSIGEPGTQMTLKTFHFAGVASMSITQGVPRIKEIINASKKIATPIITVPLEISDDQRVARLVKGRIETTTLGQVAKRIEAFFTSASCGIDIELDFDVINALQLNITYDSVITALRTARKLKLKDHCRERFDVNGNTIITISGLAIDVSARSNNSYACAASMLQLLHGLKHEVAKVIVQGIHTVSRAVINDEGNKQYSLIVEGYDMLSVMGTAGIRGTEVKSNHVVEIAHTLGIEAARDTIITEIKSSMDNYGLTIDMRHMALLADIMTYRGEVLGITRFGIAKMKESTLMLASFEKTSDHLFEAALRGVGDDVKGVSESIILGKTIPVGTGLLTLLQQTQSTTLPTTLSYEKQITKLNSLPLLSSNNPSSSSLQANDNVKVRHINATATNQGTIPPCDVYKTMGILPKMTHYLQQHAQTTTRNTNAIETLAKIKQERRELGIFELNNTTNNSIKGKIRKEMQLKADWGVTQNAFDDQDLTLTERGLSPDELNAVKNVEEQQKNEAKLAENLFKNPHHSNSQYQHLKGRSFYTQADPFAAKIPLVAQFNARRAF